MKQLFICSYLLIAGHVCFAQPQAPIDYVSLYKTCDSLNGLKKIVGLDNALTQQLHQIDKKTPYHFFCGSFVFYRAEAISGSSYFLPSGFG